MRILNVTQTYWPFLEFGGPPVKVCALARALARRGHEVSVLTADWGFERRLCDQEYLGGAGAEKGRSGWRCIDKGVEAIYLPSSLRYRTVTFNAGVRRFCGEQLGDFDVVHIFGLYDLLGPAVAAQCRARGIPYVVEPIGMFLPIVQNFWLKRMYHVLFGKKMLEGARCIVATSEQEVQELVSGGLGAEKIVLRRNGVDVPDQVPDSGKFRWAHGIPENAKLTLYLGRLSKKKNPDLLLEAFASMCKKVPDGTPSLHIVFVGPDSGMRRKLVRRARELGIASQAQFCGPLFGDQKWSAYRDADVFVLPSENENFGNSAAEAAAVGTPVIVSNRCGVAPLLTGAALVVAPERIALAHAIEQVLFDRGLSTSLRAGCRDIPSRFDWEQPARETEALYHRLAPRERCANACVHV